MGNWETSALWKDTISITTVTEIAIMHPKETSEAVLYLQSSNCYLSGIHPCWNDPPTPLRKHWPTDDDFSASSTSVNGEGPVDSQVRGVQVKIWTKGSNEGICYFRSGVIGIPQGSGLVPAKCRRRRESPHANDTVVAFVNYESSRCSSQRLARTIPPRAIEWRVLQSMREEDITTGIPLQTPNCSEGVGSVDAIGESERSARGSNLGCY
ncbi:hypothetical protein P691DRAFT_781248 [Macrolepiota fuliginosa MF-IS2]|uniref:Uncharacterized protein n=1 Tax=Macrolepiota fuliginosa MF-IS2 TaxID=1400762 RepID=A0A9P5XDC6_9AGAR|nr:hypothetical protein P691DRAFT_781248 [Macrolepiota fuliginosa MF-IS2]